MALEYIDTDFLFLDHLTRQRKKEKERGMVEGRDKTTDF